MKQNVVHSIPVSVSIFRASAVGCRSPQVVGRRLTLSGSVALLSLVLLADVFNHSTPAWDDRSNSMVISLRRPQGWASTGRGHVRRWKRLYSPHCARRNAVRASISYNNRAAGLVLHGRPTSTQTSRDIAIVLGRTSCGMRRGNSEGVVLLSCPQQRPRLALWHCPMTRVEACQ